MAGYASAKHLSLEILPPTVSGEALVSVEVAGLASIVLRTASMWRWQLAWLWVFQMRSRLPLLSAWVMESAWVWESA